MPRRACLHNIKKKKQANNKIRVLGTRLKGQIAWQLHQQAQSTQAESCTLFVSRCKTYYNPAGLCSPHLPLISAHGHQQPCCPDHIMLQPFSPHPALAHRRATEDSLTVCTVTHGNRFSNIIALCTYSRADIQQLLQNQSWLVTAYAWFKLNTSLTYN